MNNCSCTRTIQTKSLRKDPHSFPAMELFLPHLNENYAGLRVAGGMASGVGAAGQNALVIGDEWLMQGCRDASEYRHVIDKYLRERRNGPPVRTIH